MIRWRAKDELRHLAQGQRAAPSGAADPIGGGGGHERRRTNMHKSKHIPFNTHAKSDKDGRTCVSAAVSDVALLKATTTTTTTTTMMMRMIGLTVFRVHVHSQSPDIVCVCVDVCGCECV